MPRESRVMDRFADDARMRGSSQQVAVELPWLDVGQAVLVAVNRHAGGDVALAMGYRTNPSDPRVVGSDFWTNPRQCEWRLVTPPGPLTWSLSCPHEDGGEVEGGLVGDGEFVASCGQAAPLFAAVDAPLDGVPLLVCLGIEFRRTAALAAPPQAVPDLVGRLWDDCAVPRRRRWLRMAREQ